MQEKKIETEQKLRISGIQIESLKRSKQHATITERYGSFHFAISLQEYYTLISFSLNSFQKILVILTCAIYFREISGLDPSTNTYESVGRMFVLTPKSKVEENIRKKQTTAEEKIKTLEGQMSYLENSLKEATNSLRELVQQKKDS